MEQLIPLFSTLGHPPLSLKTRVDILLVGLSKDHPKAHIHEIRWILCRFHVKSGGFHVDFIKSSRFQVKSGGFHADFR